MMHRSSLYATTAVLGMMTASLVLAPGHARAEKQITDVVRISVPVRLVNMLPDQYSFRVACATYPSVDPPTQPPDLTPASLPDRMMRSDGAFYDTSSPEVFAHRHSPGGAPVQRDYALTFDLLIHRNQDSLPTQQSWACGLFALGRVGDAANGNNFAYSYAGNDPRPSVDGVARVTWVSGRIPRFDPLVSPAALGDAPTAVKKILPAAKTP